MTRKKISFGLFGFGKGNYEQEDSFPKTIKKGDMIVAIHKTDKIITYVSWHNGEDGKVTIDITKIPYDSSGFDDSDIFKTNQMSSIEKCL